MNITKSRYIILINKKWFDERANTKFKHYSQIKCLPNSRLHFPMWFREELDILILYSVHTVYKESLTVKNGADLTAMQGWYNDR